jgi:hypothetical protein
LFAGVPNAVCFVFKPVMVRLEGVAKDDWAGLAPLKPPKPPPNAPPNELPPNADLVEFPKAPNPLVGAVEGVAIPAKELNFGTLAAANGDPDAGGLVNPPNGEAAELEKLPKPDALNLSSDVCGSDPGLSELFDA